MTTYNNGSDSRTSESCEDIPEWYSCKASIKYVGFLEFFSSSSKTVFEGVTRVAKSMRCCDDRR